jgi:hypothetical protein
MIIKIIILWFLLYSYGNPDRLVVDNFRISYFEKDHKIKSKAKDIT